MLTVFALPKAFRGHFGVIQRNAIISWTRLQPKAEVILFGDDPGTAELARELGLQHVPEIERNEFGTPLLCDLFKKAHDLAHNDALCYVNADIMLTSDFMAAAQQAISWRKRFLMVGHRTNLDLDQLVDFSVPDWESRVREQAVKRGVLAGSYYIDYFLFSRDLAMIMERFAIGRPGWDNWFIWKTRSLRIPVIDASNVVIAVHQNHDYSHLPKGLEGPQHVEEARRNRAIAAPGITYALDDATYKITPRGIKWNAFYWLGRTRITTPWWWIPFAYTRSLRNRLGLTKAGLQHLLSKAGILRNRSVSAS